MATCTGCNVHIESDEGHFEDGKGGVFCFECFFNDSDEYTEEDEVEDSIYGVNEDEAEYNI